MIEYNSDQLRKAAEGDDWKHVREEFSQLSKLINKLQEERNMRIVEAERLQKVKELKALKPFSPVWYIRNSIGGEIPYGEELTKIRDGRTKMRVQYGKVVWLIPYLSLSQTKPTNIEANRGLVKLLGEK